MKGNKMNPPDLNETLRKMEREARALLDLGPLIDLRLASAIDSLCGLVDYAVRTFAEEV